MVQKANTTPTKSTVTQSAMPFIEILTQVSTFNHAELPAAAIVTNRKPVQFLHCPSFIGGPEETSGRPDGSYSDDTSCGLGQ